jgi:hypothetical protein
MRSGILTLVLLLLLLAITDRAAAQPTPPDVELTPRDIELGRDRAMERGLLLRRPPPAPPTATPIDPADRAGVLIAAATYVRDVQLSTAPDSVFFDESFHPWAGTIARDPDLSSVAISAGERQLLQRELRGGAATRDRLLTNCQPLRGCELTVPHFIVFGPPVLRQDGTVTIGVEAMHRMTGDRRPTFVSGTELVLTRMGTMWTVTRTYGGYAT